MLTINQALAEAKWRWGGFFARGFARYSSALRRPFEVGTKRFGMVKIRGQGTSWEAAFGDADRQTNGESSQKRSASG